MEHQLDPARFDRDLHEAKRRLEELRQSRTMHGADLAALLDAALTELELANRILEDCRATVADHGSTRRSTGDSERRMLRMIFQELPVPALLLEGDGIIRRANQHAAALLDTPTGYMTGKPLAAFVDVQRQAAVRTHIAAAAQSGEPQEIRTRLAGTPPADVVLTMRRVDVPGEASPIIIAVAIGDRPSRRPRKPPVIDATPSEADRAIDAAMTRFDVLSASTRQLLSDDSFSESLAVRRCARLLVDRLAAWVIVDLERDGELRRQVVLGPEGSRNAQGQRRIEEVEPGPHTHPARVHATGKPVLAAHTDDLEALGDTPDGTSIIGMLRARSVLAVPIRDDDHIHGVMTLVRTDEHDPFDLHDLNLVEELGIRVGLAIRSDRLFRRRASIADILQASLLPRDVPALPGVELAAAYLAATRGIEVGGDFYEGFESPGGWSVVLGDVCGKGEQAAALTAAARHAVRLLGHWNSRPEQIMRLVNQWLMAQADTDRFLTTVHVAAQRRNRVFELRIASAGHPPALLVTADGKLRTGLGGGLPLALFEDAEPAVEECELGTGDTLFLYSDGVLDASSPQGEQFGSERLAQILSAFAAEPVATMVSEVEGAVLEFTDGNLRDDVTMLAVRALELDDMC